METFERLGETVQLCNVYWPLEDFDKTDEIVTQLYLIIDEVEAMIPILRDERSPDLNTLIELHAALFQLLALWEAKLATLDGSRAHHYVNRQGLGPGRRRKYINVELFYLAPQDQSKIRLGSMGVRAVYLHDNPEVQPPLWSSVASWKDSPTLSSPAPGTGEESVPTAACN
eukprot:Em0003g963a